MEKLIFTEAKLDAKIIEIIQIVDALINDLRKLRPEPSYEEQVYEYMRKKEELDFNIKEYGEQFENPEEDYYPDEQESLQEQKEEEIFINNRKKNLKVKYSLWQISILDSSTIESLKNDITNKAKLYEYYERDFDELKLFEYLQETKKIEKSPPAKVAIEYLNEKPKQINIKPKTIQPPENDTLKWNEIFNSIDEYDETISELKSKSYINEHTEKWQLEKAGSKKILIFILKKMNILGYYKITPKAEEYKLIAKNTFGIGIGIDHINKTSLDYKTDAFLKTWDQKTKK